MNSALDRGASERLRRTNGRLTSVAGESRASTSEGDRRPGSDEVETRVLSKVDSEASSTDNIDARVLEALQEQPLMTKRMLLGALLIVASIFAGVTVRQYQLAVDGSIDRLARLRLSLKDGNFESRLKLLQAYRRQPALSASSDLIRTLVNRFGVSAYDTNQADTFALMKRTKRRYDISSEISRRQLVHQMNRLNLYPRPAPMTVWWRIF